jgi:oxygen-independent coproporphyrinogen-3 oxidase
MISDRLTIADDSASCYIHLPFCDRICPYCDFAVLEYDRGKANRYLAALAQEIRSSPAPAHQVRTVYLGGGTPSALEAGDISDVLALVFAKFQIVAGTVECTLEANPSRNAADLPSWRAAGVTRLSVGVQSFDDAELHRLGRTHSAADALEFVREAQTAGFGNISLDLIAGVPGQTLSTFCRSLECALAAAP